MARVETLTLLNTSNEANGSSSLRVPFFDYDVRISATEKPCVVTRSDDDEVGSRSFIVDEPINL